MRKKKHMKEEKRHMRLREKLSKLLSMSWVRFEERIPEPHKDDEEDVTFHKFTNF